MGEKSFAVKLSAGSEGQMEITNQLWIISPDSYRNNVLQMRTFSLLHAERPER